MSSVSPIDHDETFPQDAVAAQDRVDSAKLQTQVSNTKEKINEIITVLDGITRDDDTLADESIRLRMLHRELLAVLAASSEWQPKAAVRVASTANLSLTGAATVDGVAVSDDDRVLVKDQTDASENGIYVADTGGAWTRATDMDAAAEVPYAMVSVLEGTANGGGTWLALVASVTLDTTDIPFEQIFAPGQILAGNGLTKSGVTISVNVDGSTIEINADIIRLKDGGIVTAKLGDLQVTTAKLAVGAATNDKLAAMATLTIKGNITGGSAAPQDLTAAQVVSMLPVVVGDSGSGGVKGLVPAPAPGDAAAGKFFNAAGGYSVPPGGSGVNIQAFKDPCRVASTGNLTLSGVQTIDGVACIAGDRVLARAQTASAENGIYVMAAGVWARATDADTNTELVPGTVVHVNEGTLAGTMWRFTGSGAYVLGVTAIALLPLWMVAGGELYGDAVSIPVTTAVLSAGVSSSAFGRMSASGSRLTVGIGAGGTYLLAVELSMVLSTPYIDALRILKNGSVQINMDAHLKRADSTNRASWGIGHRIITLADGDYVEVQAGQTDSAAHNGSLSFTIFRIGD